MSASPLSVKVSSRYQIAIPSLARSSLNIEAGDRLLVDIQDRVIVLIPQPAAPPGAAAGNQIQVRGALDIQGQRRAPLVGSMPPHPRLFRL
jgi:AbrB family looped-hinge helix DNA binding protein